MYLTYSTLLPDSEPMATTDIFIISVVLSFPEWHIIEIIDYIAFLDWFFSLSNMQFRFIQDFLSEMQYLDAMSKMTE